MEEKYICYKCVGEEYLKSEFKKNLVVDCSYCGNVENEGYPVTELAHRIDIAFQQHYIMSPDSPPDNWTAYQYNNLEYEPKGTAVLYAIADAAGVEEEIAVDVQQFLAELYSDRSADEIGQATEYNDESYYDDKDTDDAVWLKQWDMFEKNIKSSARFFSKDNEDVLKSVFDDLASWDTRDKKPVVRIIGPDSDIPDLYRARVFQSESKLLNALKSPDKELGQPPSEYATGGRMNARGISVFYGATEAGTALAEIRPPVGSKVAVARFVLERPLKVLDLSALKLSTATGSIFDEFFAEQLSKSMFLRKLSKRMTKAVMPNDEHAEYLITQVIAEFLAANFQFEGIIFPSAQAGRGLNVTLFHQASRVAAIEYLKDTEIDVHISDWEDEEDVCDYDVIRWIPEKTDTSVKHKEILRELPIFNSQPKDHDIRVISLSIDLVSIRVEYIQSVNIESQSVQVRQLEFEKSKDITGEGLFDYGSFDS